MNRWIVPRALALAFVSTACMAIDPAYHVQEITPEIDGEQIVRTDGNVLNDGSLYPPFALHVQRFTDVNGVHSYQLVVRYESNRWFFISKGESLFMEVDGQCMTFSSPQGSLGHREELADGVVGESAWYDVSAEQLREIARATHVTLQIVGTKYAHDLMFSDGNFDHFRLFAQQYVVDEELHTTESDMGAASPGDSGA